MNVLKVAIQNLRSHLGKDTIGLKLLEVVTAIANEQRKRVAALEESSVTNQEDAKAARAAMVELQIQVAKLSEDLERQSALCEAAKNRERSALAQVQHEEPLEPMNDRDLLRRIQSLNRNVQRRFKKLPIDRAGKRCCLYLEDFVKNHTYDEFAGLGMALSACVVMGFPFPKLVAEQTYRTIHRSRDYDPENDLVLARFVHWYRDFIYFDPVSDKIFSATELPKE